MAATLTQDAVLNFLQGSGGSVKNSDLLQHFRNFIRDHADQDRNRELFKKFVNSVATVRQDDGVSYIVLRKQFRSERVSSRPQFPAGEIAEPSNLLPAVSAEKSRLKPQQKESGTPAPAGEAARKSVLPAAGIMINNNNVDTNINIKPLNTQLSARSAASQLLSRNTGKAQLKTPTLSEPPSQNQRSKGGQPGVCFGPLPEITPVAPAIRHHGEASQQVPASAIPAPQTFKAKEIHFQAEGGLHHINVDSRVTHQRVRYRPSYKSAMSCDDDEEEEEEDLPMRWSSGGAVWPVNAPLRDTARAMSTSSPCIIDHPVPPSVVSSPSSLSERETPKILIQDVDRKPLASLGPGWSSESGLETPSLSGQSASTRRSLPSEAECYRPSPDPQDQNYSLPAHVQLEPTQGLHQNQRVQLLSSQRRKSPSRESGWQSSYEDLQAKTGATGQVPQILDVLQRARGTALESTCPTDEDLLDNFEEVGSSDGSTSTPRLRQRPALSRRLSRDVRSRMCRSLGADLDQLVQEEVRGSEAARLNRLHLISSSLSLRANLSSSSLSSCSTPPRCHSLVELDEEAEQKGGRRSLPATAASPATHQEAHVCQVKQSLIPLEPREHAWYVKAAVGAWPDIYSLFREDPSLLSKHDFISGFTVLHWIAKHGDHRVLNTLWYGVQKAGLTFNVNARSLCGHTPLHIAAIHGSKNIMQLLVKSFGADVKLRDIAGKRSWQYLSGAMSPDIFQLLGAPARAALEGVGGLEQQQQQQRRRRHHLSSASSGERPSIVAGMPKVKRSTSLAAFLKHKSLLPFHGQQSDSSL